MVMTSRRLIRWLVLATLITTPIAGCARNPVTGQLQLALISEAQEIELGRQAAAEISASVGLVDDAALQNYVQELGRRLASTSERPHLPWSFAVVDDPVPNAFALPGGYIFITRGMMALMGSEAQLASVLGHEIGHVTARHHVTSMSRSQLAQFGLGIGSILVPELQGVGQLAGVGLQLLFLSHSRDAERQADDLGFAYTLAHGYDVREMPLVFESLRRIGERQQAGSLPSWLQTHPEPGDRIAAIERRIAESGAAANQLTIAAGPYLDRLNGVVYGENPRNGFFRDDAFLHPELRFQLRFPAGWQRQNLAHAVIAVSPNRDAVIELTLASEGSVDAAARSFLSPASVQTGATLREPVNGLPALFAEFRAQTQQQQVVQGLAGFIDHGGRIYKIIGYSPVQSYTRYDRAFQQVLASFAPLTDPAVLNLQPDLLRIERAPETLSLNEFNRRFPSAVELDLLVILNQMPTASTPLPAGTRVKRIVAE